MNNIDVVGVLDYAHSELLYPLSSAQQGIWLDQVSHPASTNYIIGPAIAIDGALDVAAFEQATKHVANLYDALRIVLHERSGVARQSILPCADFTLTMADYSDSDDGDARALKHLHQAYNRPFELYGGLLWEAQLVRVGPTRHYWLQRYHHLVADGVSAMLHINAVIDCYNRLIRVDPLPTGPGPSYLEILAEDRAYLESKRYARDLDFWCNRFAEIPPPLISQTDIELPPGIADCGQVAWSIERSLFRRITAFSTERGLSVTHFMVALICAYFARTNGVEEMIIGLSVHNRSAARRKCAMGTFVSVIPVVIAVDRSRSFSDLMQAVATELRRCFRHQRVPLADVNRHLKLAQCGRQQLFDVTFSSDNFFDEHFFDGGVKTRFIPQRREFTHGPLGICIRDWQQAYDVTVEFNFQVRALAREIVENARDGMALIVDAVIGGAERAIDDLPLMSEGERDRVIKFFEGAHSAYAGDDLLHRLFEAQVTRSPQAIAVAAGHEQLTYAQLNERANQLAHYLIKQAVGPDQLVALFMERSVDLVVGVLGVLKAGAAYVPIDPSYPLQRVRHVLADAMPRAVITQERLRGKLPEISGPVIAIDAQCSVLAQQAVSNPDPRTLQLTPRRLAYVLYTSGSTGTPKGVMVEHAGLLNYVQWALKAYPLESGEAVPVNSPLAFDATVTSLYCPLLSGRSVVLLADGEELEGLEQLLQQAKRWSLIKISPAHLQVLGQRLQSLKLPCTVGAFVIGGEALPPSTVKLWRSIWPHARMINEYGPTETVVGCSVYDIPQDWAAAGSTPIGRPIANVKIYILDGRRRPVAIGVAGEIYIGGAGVARGYLNRPQLTAERFVADPFSSDPQARMYRTGDLGRWRLDGNIEFLGRNDRQVKIRGFRIELGEIEARLAEYAGVGEVAVVAREEREGEKRLVAYYTGADAALSVEELRAHMKAGLPEYMLPSAYVRMERLPLTENGKLDRKALPAPDTAALRAQEYEEPRGEIEVALAGIWQELLQVERVGRLDNFFKLGGHSLFAVQMIERLRRLQITATVRDVFSSANLAELAAVLHKQSAPELTIPPNKIPAGCSEITPEMLPLLKLEQRHIDQIVHTVPGGAQNVQDIYPLAPLQEGILFHHLLNERGETYVLPVLLEAQSREKLDAFLKALQAVIDRHDILRTAILWKDMPRPLQVVYRKAVLPSQEIEPDPRRDAVSQLIERLRPEWLRMDLSCAPLIRVHLARESTTRQWYVLLYLHHLIIDHVTTEILLSEVMAHLEGRAGELREPIAYRQFVGHALAQRARDDAEKFFRAKLSDVDEPCTPFGLTDIYGDGAEIEDASLTLETELAERVRRTAQELSVSAATLFHVAWSAVIAHSTGRDDVVFGSVLSGRWQGAQGVDRVLGMFINTLPLRLRIKGRGVREMVRHTHEELTELLEHEQISLALAQNCSGISGSTPLFSAVLNYRHSAGRRGGPIEQEGHASGIRLLAFRTRNNYPLTVSVDDLGDGFALTALADARVGAQRMTAYVHTALKSLVDALQYAPETQTLDLQILPLTERRRLIEEFNATATSYAQDGLLHRLFEAQVARSPQAIAVMDGREQLTYAQLNERANQLAHYLAKQGVGPDQLVALFMERSVDLVVGVLGVLKAGAAYVPIDPSYPLQRVRQMLADAMPPAVITQESLRGKLPEISGQVIAIDAQRSVLARQAVSNPDPRTLQLTPRRLAYVLYTSGSTGAPKGVMVEHRNIVNYSLYAAQRFDVGNGLGSLICTSLSFDLTLTSFYPPLITGRPLLLCPEGQDLQELSSALLGGRNLAPLKLTPSHLVALQQVLPAEQIAGRVRTLVLGGEPIANHAVQYWMRHAPQMRVFNHYGPTEATVGCAVYEIDGEPSGTVPIGRPIANVKIYILDERRRPVAIGVAGEIYIGGAGVARGYLNRPQLTAERFVADPFGSDPQARMYRTGDVGRWRPDGNIEFLGRNDQQVKIRGFRIELGEIEARLAEYACIGEVAVIAREEREGEKRLVAYYTGADAALSVEELRAHMKASLPEYMLPSAYVRMERLPLTANGKLDRKALPAPDSAALQAQEYEEPRGEIEVALAGIWQELLQVERVGRLDNFFELGGHSLLAVQLLTRIRSVLRRELALRDLFEEPTLQAVAKNLSGQASIALQPIERADRAKALPLSYAQQRLWFVDRLEGAGSAYHIAGALKLRGQLDKHALESALDTIVQRHEVLRTVFTQVEGNPIQVISATAKFALRYIDLSAGPEAARDVALRHHTAQEVSERFDLSAGPLIRAGLIRLGDHEHVLLIAMHHIVSDGWSIGILIEELRALYTAYREGRANPLLQLPIQYADYAVWQRQWLQGGVLQAQLNYWKAQLAGAPALLELPTDRPRPPVQNFRGGSVAVVLEAGLTDELNAFSRNHDVTLFMTLYAGFAILLSRLSGQQDIVIGSPLANRQRMEVEPLIGFFVNTLPLRIRLDDDPSASELLQRVKEMTLAAYSHQDIPFEQIVEEIQPPRSLSHSPVYQVSLTWGNTPQSELSLPGLTLARMEVPRDTTQIDLSLILREEGGRIVGNVDYAGGLFDRATIERWMQHFTTALIGILQDAERPVTDIPLLSEQECRYLIQQFNATEAPYRKDTLIHELFEEHVDRNPAAIAVTFEGRRLTYGELNRQANQLAHYLRERGARPDTPVAICIHRGVEMVVGLLGILKAGAAYVPLDPSYPEERLAYILEDTGAPILLTSESIEQMLPVTLAYVIAIDNQWAEIAKRKDTNLHRAATGVMPERLAYVIYTSGSTGRPKGVMVEHRNLANLVHWHCAAFDVRAGQRSTSVAGFGFDAAVWEMWTALCAGAELVLPSPGLTADVENLLGWWERQQIDVSFLPTPMAEFAFNRGIDNSHLRILLVGGDQLLHRPDRSRKYQLFNNYGLTETTVVATSGCIDASEKTAHIGRPISNTQIYILDAHHQPVPIGVVGELYVGGASVARGYLNRRELTAERFVRDPFSSDPQARMYKTGDLGRWRADGKIEFVGRNDQQVKIRGYRIELGEIESQLSGHEQVNEAVVVVQEGGPGEKHMVAYVTYAGKPPSTEDLRAYLKSSLPSHMIPAAFVPLEALPLTPNGKVDRQALPAPEWDAFAVKRYEPPQGEIEEALADIWQELLRIDRVGRHDNFFELGGHSLLAVQAIARIRQNLEVEISLAKLFNSPSVAALAEMVFSAQLAQFDPADIARISAELVASSET